LRIISPNNTGYRTQSCRVQPAVMATDFVESILSTFLRALQWRALRFRRGRLLPFTPSVREGCRRPDRLRHIVKNTAANQSRTRKVTIQSTRSIMLLSDILLSRLARTPSRGLVWRRSMNAAGSTKRVSPLSIRNCKTRNFVAVRNILAAKGFRRNLLWSKEKQMLDVFR
jgi:hypothetical protein